MAHAARLMEIAQDVFHRAFRCAIGVDRLLRAVFVQNHIVLIAIGGAGRGKDEIQTSSICRGLNQGQGSQNIVAPV